jgi:hypothetical protein
MKRTRPRFDGGHDPCVRRDLVMYRKLAASLMLLAAGGCRMCSDSCDYSPPVAGSPHDTFHSRAGSATDVSFAFTEPAAPQPLPPNPPITPAPQAP